ncbi:hypothetical protein GGS26DRAFT_588223 [Hypomontagnella submonticulosa]|nr:hypothetical protein GGS26DRAFT_588223 [Hypomontagnella submonticulosa]
MRLPPLFNVFKDEKDVYDGLQSSDVESEETLLRGDSDIPRTSRSPSILRRVAMISGRIVIILLSAWGLISLYNTVAYFIAQSHNPPERFAAPLYPSCSCGGTTVAEAKRRGCIFTPLAIAWLPSHCVDMELSDDFDKQGPGQNGEWDYWSDINMTRRLTREEVGDLADHNGVFYATQDWHVTHCVYTWMKHYRSKWTGVTIERRSNGLDHIGHCKDVLKIRGGLQEIKTVAGIALDADDPGRSEL